jgi:hypothetical protein
MEEKRVHKYDDQYEVIKKVIYYIIGVLEVLFAFRLLFKLLGANPASAFVSFIYTISGAFLVPFNGIFRSTSATQNGVRSILETNTIVAMIVYFLIAWGIVKLVEIYMHPREKEIK